ncbi:MAG: HlyC/CorC family transporter [Planctomycetes bacterium]|nr:HlyC/CorC family transporter [Planctomycetota bacterium]
MYQYSHSKLEKLLGSDALASRVSARLSDFDRQTLALAIFNAAVTVTFLAGLFHSRPPESPSTLAVGGLLLAFFFVGFLIRGFVAELVSHAPERVLLWLLTFIVAVDRVLSPLTLTVVTVSGFLARTIGFGANGASEPSSEVTEDILDVVAENEAGGGLEADAAEFIENIVESRDLVTREVMTPRTSMICAQADITFDEALAIHNEHGHSRVPVFEENRDHIVGMLYFKDLLRCYRQAQEGSITIRDLTRPALFVPESKKITELLKDFQLQKVQIAVVLDEFGGTAGIITVEDIVEEIVGELQDEFDTDEPEDFEAIDTHSVAVSGTLSIDDLNDHLSLQIPDDDDYETIAGFLAAKLGKVPAKGENYQHDRVNFEVVDADERKVKRVLVTVSPPLDET